MKKERYNVRKLGFNFILGTIIEMIAGITMAMMFAFNKEISDGVAFCFMMGIVLSAFNIFDLGYGEKQARISES